MNISAPGINKVGIVGAGTMGRRLAEFFCFRGLEVRIWGYDLTPESTSDFSREFTRGARLSGVPREAISQAFTKLSICKNIAELHDADLIIEAVSEDLTLKKSILESCERVIRSDVILGSNTSSLPIGALATSLSNKANFLGLHFFNPPLKVPLVELVPQDLTSTETVARLTSFLQSMELQIVYSPDIPGFIVNRLLFPMLGQAIRLLEECTIAPKEVDAAMKIGAGQPMGPLELADFIGLDVCKMIFDNLSSRNAGDIYATPRLLNNLVEAGSLGRKSKKGFYDY